MVVVFLGLVFALGAAGYLHYFRTPLLEHGDIAVNALQVGKAKEFAEIYGNYSRFEFNHPGPAFYYVYAAGEWLLHDLLGVSPSPGNAHLFACMALQSFFLALGLGIFCANLPGRPALPALLILAGAWFFGFQQYAFMSIWPPHVLLMPVLCYVIACVSIASGRFQDVPWAVLSGSFAFHGHVAQALLVGGLAALTLWLFFRRNRAESGPSWRELWRIHRGRLNVSLGLAALFLLPLAIDVATRGLRSNVATIFGRFWSNTSDSKSALQSLLYFFSFGTASDDQENIFTVLGPRTWEFFEANGWRLATWAAVFTVPTVLAWRWRSRLPVHERRFLLTGGSFLLACVSICILWGKAQAGPMFHFNGYFYYGIYFFSLLLALGLLARYLDRFGGHAFTALACACGAVFLSARHRLDPISDLAAGKPIQRAVDAALQADPGGKPKLLVFEHTHWPEVASVALALQRHKVDFLVSSWWTFMFERRRGLPPETVPALDEASVWWITRPEPGAPTLNAHLGIHAKPAPLNPNGGEISFKGGENGFRYVLSGVTVGNDEFAATNDTHLAVRFAPQPAQHDVRIRFDARVVDEGHGDQPADVFFNGEPLGQVRVPPQGEGTIVVPAGSWNRSPVGTLELRFPKAIRHRAQRRPDYEWQSAWLLWKIAFAEPVETVSAAVRR